MEIQHEANLQMRQMGISHFGALEKAWWSDDVNDRSHLLPCEERWLIADTIDDCLHVKSLLKILRERQPKQSNVHSLQTKDPNDAIAQISDIHMVSLMIARRDDYCKRNRKHSWEFLK